MPIAYEQNRIVFEDMATVEEAEGLLDWLSQRPAGGPPPTLDLTRCRHLHTANLQVVMAAQPRVSAWPEDEELRSWLQGVLKPA